MSDLSDKELLDALGVETESKKKAAQSPREERIISSFEEIQRFYQDNQHAPCHGEDQDIFERLYAVRLDRLRSLEDCKTLLTPLDYQGLLEAGEVTRNIEAAALNDEALLAELGADVETASITDLRHVRSNSEKRAAEEIANRQVCEDFDQFEPLFKQVKMDIADGIRETRPFVKDSGFLKAGIVEGQYFIVGGQTAYVADVGDEIKAPNGELDARLRVIYSNGTESNLLRRSLQRALYKDEAGRRITDPAAGPLFADSSEDDDLASGTIYVLRSKSMHPVVLEHRDVLHKIGVTGSSVEKRVANATKDPTFLMAEVEIVATYELFNISRTKLEKLIHQVFGRVQLSIDIIDRFGDPVAPREWFLVPLFVIDEVVERIRDKTISEYVYHPASASLIGIGDVE